MYVGLNSLSSLNTLLIPMLEVPGPYESYTPDQASTLVTSRAVIRLKIYMPST